MVSLGDFSAFKEEKLQRHIRMFRTIATLVNRNTPCRLCVMQFYADIVDEMSHLNFNQFLSDF